MNPILLMLVAVALMSSMDATAKWLSADYPVTQVVWLRYLFGMLALVPLVLGGWLGSLRTRRPLVHLARGCLGLLGTFFFFTAIRLLPLSVAVALWFTAPIMVIVLGAVILREPVESRHVVAVILGLCGLIVMILPSLVDAASQAGDLGGIAAALGAAASYAMAIVLTRDLAATESQIGLSFIPAVFGTIAVLPFAVGSWQMPDAGDWLLFIVLGLLGSLGYVAVCFALLHERAGALAPYEYSAMVWAIAFDLLIFREPITLPAIAGSLIIIAAARIAATGRILPRAVAR